MPPLPPPKSANAVASLIRFARLMVSVLIAAVILGIGESIDALHRLDEVFAPYARTLRIVLPSLVALGFAMFMGGILWMLLSGRKAEGARLYVIASGVALMVLTGFAAGIVFGEPGLRMLLFVVIAYAIIRIAMRKIHKLRSRA